MKLTTEIKVPSNELQFLQNAVNEPNPDLRRDEVVFENTAKFSDNNWALFQVIASSNPSEESCWTQIVLFDPNGNEIACSDVSENILGPCEFFYIDGTAYTVNVVEG